MAGADYANAQPAEDLSTEEGSEEDEASKQAKEDPLAAQVWRLYTKAKDSLPNGKRLENLTWRMMAMTLHKKNKEKEDKERSENAMDLERTVPAGQPRYVLTRCPTVFLFAVPCGYSLRALDTLVLISIFSFFFSVDLTVIWTQSAPNPCLA